jgi:2-(3-amino-3-carboxypropyl)histidine synthase
MSSSSSSSSQNENNDETTIVSAAMAAVSIDDDPTTTAASPPQPNPKKKKTGVRRIIRKKKGSSKRRDNGDDDNNDGIDPVLLEKVMKESNLPQAYSFEISKTVKRINQILQLKIDKQKHQDQDNQKKDANENDNVNVNVNVNTNTNTCTVHIALQMPEGLLLYATVLSDVLQRLVIATNVITTASLQSQNLLNVSVLGDVTYGACCVDDLGARALGCDLLVHYGHSCLVPIQHTVIPCLYVFVEITIDVPHLVECFHQTILKEAANNNNGNNGNNNKPHIVYLLGTIQFRHALMEARRLLRDDERYMYNVSIPQAKPLSPGEVLGCTSPVLTKTIPTTTSTAENNKQQQEQEQEQIVLFIADGRFHLESTMISNPHINKFYRYDPYPKKLTEESYNNKQMKSIRYNAILKAKKAISTSTKTSNETTNSSCCVFGIILGTLGRQGNPALLTKIQTQLSQKGIRSFVMLASEITPIKLALFKSKVQVWIQIACPRLSVDWGHHLSGNNSIPVLNPYELFVTLDIVKWRGNIDGGEGNDNSNDEGGGTEDDESYPMDYYSQDGGPWSNYGDVDNKNRQYTKEETISAS